MARLQAEMDLEKRYVSLKRKIDARSLLGAWLNASAPTSLLVVNLKDKGAKRDATTDDTAAIQAAIDEAPGLAEASRSRKAPT